MPTCIFPGSFDPFHNGHLMVVKGMIHAYGNATIVISDTHPDAPHQHSPLFSATVRSDMIGAALLDADITEANIVIVKNDADDMLWAKYVLDAAGNPSDALVWSGDAQVREIFTKLGIATKAIIHVPGIFGDHIREQIRARDEAWKKNVPSAVIDRAVDM